MTTDRHDTASRVRRAAAAELAKSMPFDSLVAERFLDLAEKGRLTLPEVIGLIEDAIATNQRPGDVIRDATRQLRDQVCPQCRGQFALQWNDYSYCSGTPQTLLLRGCPSGGIYDVRIKCPHCDYEEEL